MFSWIEFSFIATHLIDDLESRQDTELEAMLSLQRPPPRKVDEIGRLFPNTATINKHPDPTNLRRVLQIRSDHAKDEGYMQYVAYAERLMQFMDAVGPFSDSNPLYFISLCTNAGFYEFLYAPNVPMAVFASTGHLGNPRAG